MRGSALSLELGGTWRLLRTDCGGFQGKPGAGNRRERGGQAELAPAACAAVWALGLLPFRASVPHEESESHRLRHLHPSLYHLAKTRCGWSAAAPKQSRKEKAERQAT